MNETKRRKEVHRLRAKHKSGSDLKTNRTLSLSHHNFEKLQMFCAKNKIPVSAVIDELIQIYLDNPG